MATAARVAAFGASFAVGAAATTWIAQPPTFAESLVPALEQEALPHRKELVKRLFSTTASKPFDVLIIGGGATGAGCALDAATRGLKTALVEEVDFAAGASSRSTKLVHGGVRYLEKAVFKLDPRQLNLVTEALQERAFMLQSAPHLAKSLPILTPCYHWWEVPYYWAGLKAYDLVSFGRGLTNSHYVGAQETLRMLPTLAPTHEEGGALKGSIVYYDGQFDDARYNLAVALTATLAGATVVNHAKVMRLLKNTEGRVVGATVRDTLTGRERDVYANVVVNATGPFADGVRRMSDPNCTPMIQPSAGAHVTLPDFYAGNGVGMIIPRTKDGRVLFMLPWQNQVIAGTTDEEAPATMTPSATEADVTFILEGLADYLGMRVRRQDVRATWSGIRPLAVDPTATNTADAVREHVVVMEPDGLLTVAGGKWTTYRKMAQDTIDAVCKSGRVKDCAACQTMRMQMVGAVYHYPMLYTDLAQRYAVSGMRGAVDTAVAQHLADSYGDRSQEVIRLALSTNTAQRLVPQHPVLEAEVVWAARNEMCETVEDFLARRSRLAFLDRAAALEAVPRVVELMGREKRWGWWRRGREAARARRFLQTFGCEAPKKK